MAFSLAAATVGTRPSVVARAAPVRSTQLQKIQSFDRDIERYMYLRELQRTNKASFNSLLVAHTESILPFIYTPTVGEACQHYDELKVPTYGLYIRHTDRGHIKDILSQYADKDIRVVVVTDGERILGLGDLGTGGMGISEGKSLLYTAAAGIAPEHILPVCLDVGTERASLRESAAYSGLRQHRVRGEEYFAFVDEFVSALEQTWPHVLLQFEDFGNHTAFELLDAYRSRLCCFNDDIQGTACVALAGVLSALRASGGRLKDQRFLFLGAGEAGTGIGELIARAAAAWDGLSLDEARKLCYYVDSQGLVTAERAEAGAAGLDGARPLQAHKLPFAHPEPEATKALRLGLVARAEEQNETSERVTPTLLELVETIRPTALVGVAVQPGAFDADVLAAMARNNERPIVFPLSNPTSKAECTFQQAYEATQGRVLFASGSPFPAVERVEPDGSVVRVQPAQANNAYVFPAIGHAAVLTNASTLPDGVFLVAAAALASMTSPQDLDRGALFPPFSAIRDVSETLIAQCATYIIDNGLGTVPEDFEAVAAAAGVAPEANQVDKWAAYAKAHFYMPQDEQAYAL